MDLPVWLLLASVLLLTAQAGPTDQGPQTFADNKSSEPAKKAASEPKQKQHKRTPKYEMQMKEVILYLTPSQIRALEAGQGFIQPQSVNQPEVIYEQFKEQMQNVFNEQGQKLQKQVEDIEASRKHKMQSKNITPKPPTQKNREKQQLSPEHNAHQTPQLELQKREKYYELPLHFQLIPQPNHHTIASSEPQLLSQVEPTATQLIEQPQIQSSELSHYAQQLSVPELQLEHIPEKTNGPEPKTPWLSQNYAYLYLYPRGKPLHPEKLSYPQRQEEKSQPSFNEPLNHPKELHIQSDQLPKELLIQSKPLPEQFVFQAEHLPKQLLIQPQHFYKQLLHHPDHLSPLFDVSEHLPKQLFFQTQNPILPFHSKFQLIPYEYGYESKVEAQKILQDQLTDHQLDSQRLRENRLKAQQMEIDIQDIIAQKNLEVQYQQISNNKAKKDQEFETASKIMIEQIQEGLKNLRPPEVTPEIKPPRQEEIHQIQGFHKQQMQEVIEAHKLKAQIEAQEKEAHRLDAQLEAEQLKGEKMRQEQNQLEFLRALEPKRTQMHSILTPLFQGHNIMESLEEQKANFPHHKISLEKGFRPLQYAPKYNDEKYAKEVEKILRKNRVEKEKAYAKAVEIANEPPEITSVTTKEDEVTKQRTMEIVKHVQVPTPVYLPVPEPFEVKMPQPYPVPLEILRPIPIPIVKMEKVEVEKPVPVEVEKRVPVPITKNVYVKVDKPYFVQKVVPVQVKKEIPVEIPIHKPQKLSIIRHIWEH